jgi:hypothetical protein
MSKENPVVQRVRMAYEACVREGGTHEQGIEAAKAVMRQRRPVAQQISCNKYGSTETYK